jgi:hypothetical protein
MKLRKLKNISRSNPSYTHAHSMALGHNNILNWILSKIRLADHMIPMSY